MTKLLTVAKAALHLNVTRRYIGAMLKQPCPACTADPDCPRCRGTGHKLPYIEGGGSGNGIIRHIWDWALELPDVANPARGQPSGVPGVTVLKGKEGYDVFVKGEKVGAVWKASEAQRSWRWRSDQMTEGFFSTRKAAIVSMMKECLIVVAQ